MREGEEEGSETLWEDEETEKEENERCNFEIVL